MAGNGQRQLLLLQKVDLNKMFGDDGLLYQRGTTDPAGQGFNPGKGLLLTMQKT